MNRTGRSQIIVLTSLLGAGVLAAVIAFTSGCDKRVVEKNDPALAEKKTDPWESVSRKLRKDIEVGACKTALGQLNSDLAERSDVEGTKGLTDEGLAALKARVPLSAEDEKEIRAASFSSLDPAYLADCFFFRDAARSLELTGLPPAERALVGFQWVCRQLYLNTWFAAGKPIPAVPSSYTLRRGYGSGLDAYVFLALLQQAGLDGCLIGSTGAAEKPSFTATLGKDGKPVALLIGPFWAVGVRVGADILLFSVWRGEPFPGPGGKGIATLAQVKADPAQLQAWFDDKSMPWSVTADDIKNATVSLAVPMSSLSPRMAMLEKKVKSDTATSLAMDLAALRERFTTGAPNGPGIADVKFWNLAGDPFSYCRALHAFLPLEDGGLDRSEQSRRLHTMYLQSMIPFTTLNLPPDVKPQVSERLAMAILQTYKQSFIDPPSPRERIQRGQFQEAARDLTDKLATFGRGQERLRAFDPAEVAAWVTAANAAYDHLTQRRFPGGQLTPLPDSDPDVVEARGIVEEFWRTHDAVPRLLVDRATVAIGRTEASYLLALAKHEEAERQQVRAEHATGAESAGLQKKARMAWAEASNAWTSFLEQNSLTVQEGRTTHAQRLALRGKALAEAK